ncbi:4-hydroxy-tetrahydrodipicolinate reductase [Clostridium oceanicum]|uniref:4-hydroxy-tetrahydrodipicolinate reductase n=1 Tax=Clostridium oceanicum TaxID=1543 RepID=A0ABN1JH47_9CLOT
MRNIIVIGPKGKMGRLVVKSCYENKNINIVGALAPKEREYIGQDIGQVSNLGVHINEVVSDDLEKIIHKCDCIIDFTTPKVSMEVFEVAFKNKKSVVCGTTGFSQDEIKRIKEISKEIPIVLAANTSMVVNLMYNLVEIASKAIGNMSDIEILEMHDKNKKDAPSGTSLEIGNILAESLNKKLNDIAVFGRHGEKEREEGTIGYHSLRAGDISSSHTVMFGLMGERLEITHHAYNFQCFANGASIASVYLKDKKPGVYSMKEVIGLK